MRAFGLLLLLGASMGLVAGTRAPPHPATAECADPAAGPALCLYRSMLPSAGIVTSCSGAQDCRVGYYYGDPADAVWFRPPPGLASLPSPAVFWLTPALAQVRVRCGPACAWSYFFDARRRRVSEPRPAVLAVDPQRLLMASAAGRALTVRQVFSGREVARIERDWAPAEWLGDVIPVLHFDPDGRLSFTWLRGQERVPVSERVSIPSSPRS